MASFHDIKSKLPIAFSNYHLSNMNLNDLMNIRNYSKLDMPEKTTCRPIIERNAQEAEAFYQKLLLDESLIFIGIYDNNSVIGNISLSDYNYRNQSCELGYFIMPKYRGKGTMKEAIGQVIPIALKCNINKIYAQTAVFNKPSIMLLYGLGFKCDGHLREHHELNNILYDDLIFSITKNDYINSQS